MVVKQEDAQEEKQENMDVDKPALSTNTQRPVDPAHVTELANFSIPDQPQKARYVFSTKLENGTTKTYTNRTLPYQPTKEQFNEGCIYYEDDSKNFFPTPLAFARIEVPDEIKQEIAKLPKKQQGTAFFKYKLDVLNNHNASLGITGTEIHWQTDPAFPHKNGRVVNPEHKIVQKANGEERVVQTRYRDPFQSGAEADDIWIIHTGGVDTYKRYPGDNFAGKGIEELRAKIATEYGEDAEIKLRSDTGIMHDADYLDAYEKDGADVRFRALANEYIQHNEELPLATVNIGRMPNKYGGFTRDDHVCVATFRAVAGLESESGKKAAAWISGLDKGDHWDRVQVRDRSGNRLKTLNRLYQDDPPHFNAVMKEVGLPPSMGKQEYAPEVQMREKNRSAPALVQDGPHIRDARDVKEVDLEKAMIADRSSKGNRTGSYTSLQEYKRRGQRLPEDAAAALKLSPDAYLRDKVVKGKPMYDPRPKGTHVNGL